MSAQHTPGPWKVEPQEYGVVITHQGGSMAAAYPEDMLGRKHDALANARLIAAAPDLLAVLERIARPLDCGCVPCTGQCRSQEALSIIIEEMQDDARDAIAKAKGAAA